MHVVVLSVVVFPVSASRWIAAIDNAAGPFTTEATTPEGVSIAVREAIAEVLGDTAPDHRLVDEHGQPWDRAVAARQLAALDEDSQRSGSDTQRWCAVCSAPAAWAYEVEARTSDDRILFHSPWPVCNDCHLLAERDDLPGLRKRWDLAEHGLGRADRKYVTREFLARKQHAQPL